LSNDFVKKTDYRAYNKNNEVYYIISIIGHGKVRYELSPCLEMVNIFSYLIDT